MWGGELGFGMEYFFDENFSLGGEFGLRYLHLRYKDSYNDEIYNPNTGQDENVEIKNRLQNEFQTHLFKNIVKLLFLIGFL